MTTVRQKTGWAPLDDSVASDPDTLIIIREEIANVSMIDPTDSSVIQACTV